MRPGGTFLRKKGGKYPLDHATVVLSVKDPIIIRIKGSRQAVANPARIAFVNYVKGLS